MKKMLNSNRALTGLTGLDPSIEDYTGNSSILEWLFLYQNTDITVTSQTNSVTQLQKAIVEYSILNSLSYLVVGIDAVCKIYNEGKENVEWNKIVELKD